MPVDVESDQWNKSKRVDILEVEIERFLQKNSEKAYSPAEISDHLTDEKPEVFPEILLTEESSARVSRIVLITSRLEKLAWHERVKAHALEGKLYYTNCEGGQFPIAEVERNIPNRFINIEQRIEEIDDELGTVRRMLQDLEEELPEDFDLL
ncbi:hypothetical protein C491_13337 [Natronococcus amylolyticus DSM 10524]|uniref:Uncharacterized protein n=1 Tax=Natronococcus amylolyticus DSM 10524 TaxID=1227497 RepID=L9X4B7_9EURY|nr:hypothetical protein [Natronococcus amylolyticus]ELY56525.1 hypothetical protein C491_13337 [Natronococcus amylolyticus DSM 10524]